MKLSWRILLPAGLGYLILCGFQFQPILLPEAHSPLQNDNAPLGYFSKVEGYQNHFHVTSSSVQSVFDIFRSADLVSRSA